jgi:predicted amino acid-binding ACT domain protein
VRLFHHDPAGKLAEVDAHSETPLNAMVEIVDHAQAAAGAPYPENVYVLTATGTDQIGFVATLTSFCVRHNINILDLSTTVSDGAYVMILVIDLNHSAPIHTVRQDLQQFSRSSGFRVVLQHYDIFRAVNEINLPIR